jgi:ribosomal protein L11 methyltransferase
MKYELWNKLSITVKKEFSDIVVGLISAVNSVSGIEEFENNDSNTLSFYLLSISDELKETLSTIENNFSASIHLDTFEYDKSIEFEWKKYFKTKRIGKRIVIKPSWEKYDEKDNDLVITIDPGSAFGTGLHATTKGVISILEELIDDGTIIPNEVSLLDAGTGSGILSIAASKFNINTISAFDHDSDAVNVAKDNFSINNINSIEIYQSSLSGINKTYDVVLANILSEILSENYQVISNSVNSGGHLILSGILIQDEDELTQKFLSSKKLLLIKSFHIDEWTTLYFKAL